MRRIKLILATAASMAVLMVLTAAPAFADVELQQSVGGSIGGSGSGSTNVGNGGNGDIELNGGDGFTSVGNLGNGEIEIEGNDIDDNDNDIEFDGNGALLVGNVDDELVNCEEVVEIGGVFFCVDNDNDVEFVSGTGVSQEFEIGDVESGDVEPSISIG